MIVNEFISIAVSFQKLKRFDEIQNIFFSVNNKRETNLRNFRIKHFYGVERQAIDKDSVPELHQLVSYTANERRL